MCGCVGRGARARAGAPRAATSLYSRSPGTPRFPAGAPSRIPVCLYRDGPRAGHVASAHLLATPRFFTRTPLIKLRNYEPAIK